MASTASDISSNVFRVLKTIKQTSGVRGGIGGAGIGGGSAAIGGMLSQISIASFPSTAATSMVATNSVSYIDIISTIIQENGVWSLFTRGLSSRVISNGLQSILFTVVWKEIMSRYAPSTPNPTSSTNTNVNTNTNTNTNTAAINTDPSIDATHSGLTH